MTTFQFTQQQQIVAEVTIKNLEPISTSFAQLANDNDLFPFAQKPELNSLLALGQTQMVHEGAVEATCFITGGSLRARIRHACADVVVKKRKAQGNPLHMKDIYALKVGQIADAKSNKDKKEKDGQEVKNDAFVRDEFRRANPLLSHFGLFEVASTICVSHGLPKAPVKPSVIGGVRFDISPSYILENLSEEDQAAYLDRKNRNSNKSLLEADLSQLDKALKKEKKGKTDVSETAKQLQAEIDAKKAELAKLTDDEDMKNSTQMPLARHVVPVGNTFYSKIVLTDISDAASSSMLLTGLDALSRFPKIGGYKSTGGEIEMTLDLRVVDHDGHFQPLGILTVGGYQSVQPKLTELGQSWFDQARSDVSWHDKIDLKMPL